MFVWKLVSSLCEIETLTDRNNYSNGIRQKTNRINWDRFSLINVIEKYKSLNKEHEKK